MQATRYAMEAATSYSMSVDFVRIKDEVASSFFFFLFNL